MKRLVASMAGAAVLALGLTGSALADPHDHGGGHGGGGGGGHDRGGASAHGPGGFEQERRGPGPAWSAQGGPPEGGPPPGERWDEQRNDGYWIGNRWHYGPPPESAGPAFRPGYAPWRRGALLPPYYRNNVVDEYWNFHLRRPPYGYHWVRVGDSFLMVSVDSGLIFDVVEGF